MRKIIFGTLMLLSVAAAAEKMTHEHAIEVGYVGSDGKSVQTTVARDLPLKCIEEIPFEPLNYWRGDYAVEPTSKDCKRTYIISAGKISPMKMHKNIETYGELEVLEFLEDAGEDKNLLFVDARKQKWFEELTIPGAVNIPFVYFTEKGRWITERDRALEKMGVSKTVKGYDFSKAKTLLLFCNGIWCRQSPQMIEVLLEIGYPSEKMKWYRGGLQNWTSVGLTTYRPKPVPAEPKPEIIREENWFEVVVVKFGEIWDRVTR